MTETLCLYCDKPTMSAFCCITCAGKYDLREKFKMDASREKQYEIDKEEEEEEDDN